MLGTVLSQFCAVKAILLEVGVSNAMLQVRRG